MLADVLLDMHNVHHYLAFMAEVRQSIQVSKGTEIRGGVKKIWELAGRKRGWERRLGRCGGLHIISHFTMRFTFEMFGNEQ